MPHKRKGYRNWHIYVRGVSRSSGTTDYEDAQALEGRLAHQAWEQKRMGVKPPRSWQEAVVKWLEERADKHDIEGDRAKLKWLDPYLGPCQDISEITRDFVDHLLQQRLGKISPNLGVPRNSTANRYVALISAILNAAEKKWEWGNKAPTLRKYPEPKEEQRWLTVEEWRRLEDVLPDHLRRVATFSLSTGLREAKAFGLRWQNVDLVARSLAIAGTANKLGISAPLNACAHRILLECRSLSIVSPEYVFLLNGRPIQGLGWDTWKRAFEKSGVRYMKWHGLRHTFNSWLAQNGVPDDIRKRLMGHSTGSVHDRYTHLEVEHLRPYSEVIDRVLAREEKNEAANGH